MALSEGYQKYLAAIGGDAGGLGYGLMAGALTAAEANSPANRRKKALEELKGYGEIAKYYPEGALDPALMQTAEDLGLPRTRQEKTGTKRVATGAQTYIDPSKLSPEDRALYEQAGVKFPAQQQMGLVSLTDPEVRKRYEQAGIQLPQAQMLNLKGLPAAQRAQYYGLPGSDRTYAEAIGQLAATNPAEFQRLAQQPGGLANQPFMATQARVPQLVQAPSIVEEPTYKEVPFLNVRPDETKSKLMRTQQAITQLGKQRQDAVKRYETLVALKRTAMSDTPPEELAKLDEEIKSVEEQVNAIDVNNSLVTAGGDISELPPIVRPPSRGAKVTSGREGYLQAMIEQSKASVRNMEANLGLKGQALAIARGRLLNASQMLNLQGERFANTQAWQNFLADANVQNALVSATNAAENATQDRLQADPRFGNVEAMMTVGDETAQANFRNTYNQARAAIFNEELGKRTKEIRRQFSPARFKGGVVMGGAPAQAGPARIVLPPLRVQLSK